MHKKLFIFICFCIVFSSSSLKTLHKFPFTKITILGHYGRTGGGPSVVVDSLIKGLENLDINFNHNPKNINDIGDVVIVLSGIKQLKAAIQLKKEGKIKKLLAGPNLIIRSNEHNKIITSQEIDICIVPSYWVQVAYEEETPSLIGRIRPWPAGIDANYWTPKENLQKKEKNVLLYIKFQQKKSYEKIEGILKKYGWNPIKIIYGSYNHQQYKEALSKSQFAVFLSKTESQGLALAECWAMNVPSLPWDSGTLTAHGRTYSIASSCPYLTKNTGIRWKNIEEFEKIIENIEYFLPTFSPRAWVLQQMTYKASAQMMLDIIDRLA